MEIRILKIEEVPMDLIYEADPSRVAVADYLERGTCYGACIDREVTGVCVLLRTRPFTMEIVNISIAPERQGTGIGKALIAHVVEISREAGCSVLELGTANAGTGQLAFYQKCGFTITWVDFDFITKHYPEKMVENGIECRHMIRMSMDV